MSLDVSDLIGGGAVLKYSSTRTNENDGPDGGAGLGAADVDDGISIKGSADPVSDLSDSGGEDDILRKVRLFFGVL